MNKISLIILFSLITISGLIAQWNVSNNSVNWNPTNSPGLPLTYYNHASAITTTATVAIAGAAGSTYPLCGTSQLQLTFSLAGGATFIGANGNDVVSSSGDWENRFTWNLISTTSLTATLNTSIPLGMFSGTASNTFSFAVRTPSYSTQFFFSTQTTAGTGGDCSTSNPNSNGSDDAQLINAFTNRSLPVQSFAIQNLSKKPAGLQVEWMTQNENNIDYFEIERMYHGNKNEWMKVAEVKSAGGIKEEIKYDYTDKTYAKAEKIYYRVKSVSLDGSTAYTDIKAIDLKENSNVKLFGYPNPTHDAFHLNINLKEDTELAIDLIDILGKIVSKQKLQGKKGFNNQDLNFSNLGAGTYIVKVTGKDVFNTMTVVKMQ